MTPELREILVSILNGEGNEYKILTIEYPAYAPNGLKEGVCLKTVTRQVEGDLCDVDYYAQDGHTVETRHFYAREGG